MSNLYYILLTLVFTCTLNLLCELYIPAYVMKTYREQRIYDYLIFLFFLFYLMLYYWVFPKGNFWVFITYFICAIDNICRTSDVIFHFFVVKKPIEVNNSNKRKKK